MKIVITVNAAWNVWNFRRPLLRELIDHGYEVTILAPEDHTVQDLQDFGCSFRHLEMSAKGLNPLEGLQLMRQMGKVFREIGPDAILSYTIKNNIFGAFAAKLQRRHFLPNITGLGTAFLSSGLLEKVAVMLYKNAFRGLPHIFFQNGDDMNLFVERGLITSQQALLVPGSGIDLDYFAPESWPEQEDETVFLMVSRLLRDKGVFEYVDAARQVRLKHPNTRFQLLGPAVSQNLSAIDVSEVQRWAEEGYIEYLGSAEDVRPYIKAAHCLVLPSYREGAPRTLIEGASMGRPLITTDVPGCRAVVDHGSNGFHCAPQSSCSLVTAVEQFLALDPGQRLAMGEAGRVKMENEFCHTIVNRAYTETIKQLLVNQAAPS